MKKIILCIAASFLIASCSTEQEITTEKKVKKSTSLGEIAIAENAENPFDQTGRKYYNLLTLYTDTYGYPVSAQELADHLRYLSAKYGNIDNTEKSVITITPEKIALILAEPLAQLNSLIENSSLSSSIKSNLSDFVADLVDRQEDEYEEVCNFIVAYETAAIANVLLEEDEKDTILKMASISRYSLYAEARRRDRDWETAITTRPAKAIFVANQRTLITLAVLFGRLQ